MNRLIQWITRPAKWLADKTLREENEKLSKLSETLSTSLDIEYTKIEALTLVLMHEKANYQENSATYSAILNALLMWAGGKVELKKGLMHEAHLLPPCIVNETNDSFILELARIEEALINE